MARKKRLVVQFVSNCGANSGRDRLTAELQKLVEFDVFGSCNNKECDDKCYQSEQGGTIRVISGTDLKPLKFLMLWDN